MYLNPDLSKLMYPKDFEFQNSHYFYINLPISIQTFEVKIAHIWSRLDLKIKKIAPKQLKSVLIVKNMKKFHFCFL